MRPWQIARATTVGWLLASCFLAPSVPLDPGAVIRDGDRYYFDLGCPMGDVFEVRLGTGEAVFWELQSEDADGRPISGFELGVAPEGFTEVIAYDPEWRRAARDRDDGLPPGMSLTVAMDPERRPAKTVGLYVDPDQPEGDWVTNLGDDATTWDAYQRALVDDRDETFGGWGCDGPSPVPSFP